MITIDKAQVHSEPAPASHKIEEDANDRTHADLRYAASLVLAQADGVLAEAWENHPDALFDIIDALTNALRNDPKEEAPLLKAALERLCE